MNPAVDREPEESEAGPVAAASRPTSRLAGPYGHPFHPLVAAVAIGAWVGSFGFDLLSYAADTEWVYVRAAYFLVGGGVVAGVVAAMLGLTDLLGVPRGTVAFRTGLRHLMLMDATLVLFTVSFLIRRQSDFEFHDSTAVVPMALSAIGLLTMAVGGWLGGKLAYTYGVRVADEATRRLGYAEITEASDRSGAR